MGFVVDEHDTLGVAVELRTESFYIMEPEQEFGEHLFAYGDNHEQVTVEMTYEMFSRVLKLYETDETFRKRMRERV